MKHLIHILLLFTISPLHPLTLSAAVPLRWTVETSRAQPATFEAYQGETLDFEATLQSYGKPLEAPVQYAFYWQTNGMGSAYWSAPCTGHQAPSTNTLRATWLPSYDVGARAYNCFIGLSNSIYHAAFQLRLRPSPGAVPNELPLPQKVIDFSQVTVLNPPWSGGGGSGGIDTNAVIDITTPLISAATNDLNSTLTGTISSKLDKVGGGTITGKYSPIGEPLGASVIVENEFGGGGKVEINSGTQGWGGSIKVDGIDVALISQLPSASQLLTSNQVAEIANVPGKRDLTNLVVYASTLSNWVSISGDPMWTNMRWYTLEETQEYERPAGWYADVFPPYAGAPYSTDYFATRIASEDPVGNPFVIERKPVATPTSDLLATTNDLTFAISTNNPAFVSAVQSIAPPSPPSLRLYDAVRDCWWIGRMVNGIISWQVEE